MQSYYIIEAKTLSPTNTRGTKIKLSYLHYVNDTITISYDYKYNSSKDIALEFLKMAGIRVKGYGYDEKRKVYLFFCDNFEPLKELKYLSKTLSEGRTAKQGRSVDRKYFNQSEKWEQSYLPKRKTTAKRYK